MTKPSERAMEIALHLQACADDPMWADHAEVPKSLLRAAAAILAKHYAPVIADLEAARDQYAGLYAERCGMLIERECRVSDLEALVGELGEALKPFADIRTQCPESIKLIQKNVDGMKPITITVTKVQMQTAVAALAKLEKARG